LLILGFKEQMIVDKKIEYSKIRRYGLNKNYFFNNFVLGFFKDKVLNGKFKYKRRNIHIFKEITSINKTYIDKFLKLILINFKFSILRILDTNKIDLLVLEI